MKLCCTDNDRDFFPMWIDSISLADSVASAFLFRDPFEDELSERQTARGLEANCVMIFFRGSGNDDGLVGDAMVVIAGVRLVMLKATLAVLGTMGVAG